MLTEYLNLRSIHEESLAVDMRNTICGLAVSLDACVMADGEVYIYLECVLSVCMAHFLQESSEEQAVLAAECTATMLNTARNNSTLHDLQILHTVRGSAAGRMSSIVPSLLAVLPAEENIVNAVATILGPLLSSMQPGDMSPDNILQHVADTMPHGNNPSADRLFLMVVDELLIRAIAFESLEQIWDSSNVARQVTECPAIVDVVKRSVLSDEVCHRASASKVVCLLCKLCSQAAEKLCRDDVFEYLVESIRSVGIGENATVSTTEKSLLASSMESASAIARQRPKTLVDKWCYCLDVFLSVCEHFTEGEQANSMSNLLDLAFRTAPVPSFSDGLLQKVGTYEMMICTRMLQERETFKGSTDRSYQGKDTSQFEEVFDQGMSFLNDFLRRYRPNSESLHSLLRICEIAARPNQPLQSVLRLAIQIVSGFVTLCQSLEEKVEGTNLQNVQDLGQRLLFIVFDTWAPALEALFDAYDKKSHTSGSVSTLVLVVELLHAVFHPAFVLCGACSTADQNEMQRWCWNRFPPRSIFSLSLLVNGVSFEETQLKSREEENFQVLKCYLLSISVPLQGQASLSEQYLQQFGTTEDYYLASLSDCKDGVNAAFLIFETGAQLDLLDSICAPELLADSLSSRLKKIYNKSAKDEVVHCLDVARGISFICSRFSLRFRMFRIASEVLESIMQIEEYRIGDPRDFSIFQLTISSDTQCRPDVYAWDKFADYVLTPDIDSTLNENTVWKVLLEKSDVVKSVMYALSESAYPQRIADVLLKMADDQNGSTQMIKAFQQAGANDVLTNLLKTVNSKAGMHNNLHESDVDKFRLEAQNVCSFVSVLSREALGSVTTWSLLCLVCDTFVREATVIVQKPNSWLFLSNLLRWLVASLSTTTEKGMESYIHQSDVIPQLVLLLRMPSTYSIFQDQCISAGACFLIVLLRKGLPIKCSSELIEILSAFAADESAWERLFSSFSFSAEKDVAYKLTNCCFLLKSLLSVSSLRSSALQTACSSEISTLIVTASCSASRVLEEGALGLLTDVMQFSLESPSYCCCSSSVQLLLSTRKLKKVCYGTASLSEWNFVEATVSIGYLDDVLLTSGPEIRTRIVKMMEACSEEFSQNKGCVKLLQSSQALLSSLDTRWTKIVHAGGEPTLDSGQKKVSDTQQLQRPVLGEKKHPNILLGSNYILAVDDMELR